MFSVNYPRRDSVYSRIEAYSSTDALHVHSLWRKSFKIKLRFFASLTLLGLVGSHSFSGQPKLLRRLFAEISCSSL